MKPPLHKLYWTLGILIVLTAILIIVVSLYGWQRLSAPHNPRPTVNIERPPMSQLEPVMITLPGTTPFVAPNEEYHADSHIWRLVNKSNPFSELSYIPELALVTVPTQAGRGSDERSMRPDVMPNLKSMFEAAAADGLSLQVGSGYRSYATQVAVFGRYVSQVGETEARTFSAPPGHSEHQSGLAVDLSSSDTACWLETCFGDLPAGRWLAEHAHQYGFILRYPKGKESITGFQYEPWHFRYVGTSLAAALYESGLTLEEAQQYLNDALEQLKNRD